MPYSIDSWLDDNSGMASYRLNDPNGTRTTKAAKENIKTFTIRENKAKPIIVADYLARGRIITIEDTGVDNSGEFIENDKLIRAEPDWTIVEGLVKYPTEVCVHSERHKTVSFKVSKLNKAVKLSGSIMVIRESYYLDFDTSACTWLLENYEHRPFSGYGGKVSVVLYPYDTDLLIRTGVVKKFEYTPSALAEMQPLLRELF